MQEKTVHAMLALEYDFVQVEGALDDMLARRDHP